jgi:broad specificity phosphatase PhoE
MRTRILLIRHGHTDWIGRAFSGHRAGVHLTERGVSQAEALAERLAGSGISAIYSSPLERTLETAEPLARRLGLDITKRERLIEIDSGDWTGEPFADLAPTDRWKRFMSYRSATRIPGGELMLDVQARGVSELEALREKHGEATIAVFSHADVIRFVFAHYAGIAIDLAHRLEIRPASVSTLALGAEDVRILGLNDIGEP